MTDPTPLFNLEPTIQLTELQQAVLDAVRRAGAEGFNPIYPHEEQTLRGLRKLGLVRYRLRVGGWTLTGQDAPKQPGMTDEVPY